jgi:ATP-dependent protease HslVU (ClpYQ) ATPase subunit
MTYEQKKAQAIEEIKDAIWQKVEFEEPSGNILGADDAANMIIKSLESIGMVFLDENGKVLEAGK